MAEKKSEKIKFYLVIGLAVVFLIMAYFQFFRPKANNEVNAALQTHPSLEPAPMDIRKVINNKQQTVKDPRAPVPEQIKMVVRDIFSPQAKPKKRGSLVRDRDAHDSSESLKLAGTIVGGAKPIAIINNQFFRTGDWIGEFRIISIGAKDVVLDSGDQKLSLEIMKNE